MALITPNTNIILIKLPIELDAENQLTFANASDQYNYFTSISGNLILDNATYVRKDGTLRFNECFDDIINYNYCMYQNESYGNKWFYAFITDIQYLSNESSSITLKSDVFQTWQFDINYMQSFVEREHVNDDTVGLHTIPEGLETGEFISNAHIIDDAMDDLLDDMIYIVACSKNPYETDETGQLLEYSGGLYNGIYNGVGYWRCNNATQVNETLRSAASHGQISLVTGLFMAPRILTPVNNRIDDDAVGFIDNSTLPYSYNNNISKQTTIDGYTPKNKKLLSGEYNYLIVSNNVGSSYVYRYEDFADTTCNFKIDMAITPGCSIKMIPLNYKGNTNGDEYGISMGKLPVCSYNCDMYINWLTQNSINIGGKTLTSDEINANSNVFNGALSSLTNAFTGNIGGTVTSLAGGINSIFSSMISAKQHSLIPPQVGGNVNSGDVVSSSNKNNFHFYKMSIKREYAVIIDEYFNAYGYKINKFKVPNINTRRNWNYIKTIGCNIHAYAPNSDVDEIKQMFNRGITLWHHANTFLDYSQPNNLV